MRQFLRSIDLPNVLTNILVRIGAAIAALAAQFLIIRSQGESAYGQYAVLIATISMLAIFTKLGGDVTATRLAALEGTSAGNGAANQAVGIFLNSTFNLSIAVFIIYTVVSSTAATHGSTGWTVLFALASLTASSMLVSILRGFGRNLAVDVADGLARPIFLVIYAAILSAASPHFSSAYGSVVDSYILTNMSIILILCGLLLREIRTSRTHIAPHRIHLPALFANYSAFQVAATVASYALFQLDTYTLSLYTDSVEVGGYNVACNYVRLVIFVPLVLCARAQAPLARAHHAKDKIKFQNIVKTNIIYAVAASLAALAILYIFGERLLVATSSQYADLYTPLLILGAGHCFNSIAILSLAALNMSNMNSWSFYASAFGGITATFGYIILVPKYGAIGAASAASIAMFVMTIASIVYLARIKF